MSVDSQAISLVRSSFKSVAAVEDGPERLARYLLFDPVRSIARNPGVLFRQRWMCSVTGLSALSLTSSNASTSPTRYSSTSRSSAAITASTASPTSNYTAVGNALIEALETFGGAEMWTDEVDSAWRNALAIISAAMMDAANAGRRSARVECHGHRMPPGHQGRRRRAAATRPDDGVPRRSVRQRAGRREATDVALPLSGHAVRRDRNPRVPHPPGHRRGGSARSW